MTIYDQLRQPPFNLDDAAIDWVRDTYASLDLDDKVGQLFTLIMMGTDEAEFDRIAALRPGGVTRFFTPDLEFERRTISNLVAGSKVAPVISADLEGSRMSLAFGTEVPNDVRVAVHDSTADMRYLVLPKRPAGTERLGEAELAKLVTRDSMIGVSVPKA